MQAIWYEIRVQGRLDSDWADWFGGMDIRPEEDSTTVLAGPVADQAALHGLLARIANLNLSLVSINPAPSGSPRAPQASKGE